MWTCQLIISSIIGYHKVHLFPPDVGKETAIGHKGHDNIGCWASIYTQSNNIEDVRVFKALHFLTLFHHICSCLLVKEACYGYWKKKESTKNSTVFGLLCCGRSLQYLQTQIHAHHMTVYFVGSSVTRHVLVCITFQSLHSHNLRCLLHKLYQVSPVDEPKFTWSRYDKTAHLRSC